MKVLIVDDEVDLAETLARFLGRFGYGCMTALNVQKAIDLIIQNYPDLVITDYRLPDGDGFEVIKHVQQTLPQRPVIFMTGYHDPRLEQAARTAGAADYLRKPFTLAALTTAVQTALKTYRP